MDLFIAAADLQGAERDQVLAEACAGYALLRAGINSLLETDARGF